MSDKSGDEVSTRVNIVGDLAAVNAIYHECYNNYFRLKRPSTKKENVLIWIMSQVIEDI